MLSSHKFHLCVLQVYHQHSFIIIAFLQLDFKKSFRKRKNNKQKINTYWLSNSPMQFLNYWSLILCVESNYCRLVLYVSLKDLFSISCRAGLLEKKLLSFCLSEYVLISSSLLKDGFVWS